MAVCLIPEAAEAAVSDFKAVVLRRGLVSVHERTPLNTQLLSRFLKQPFFDEVSKPLKCPFSSVIFSSQ